METKKKTEQEVTARESLRSMQSKLSATFDPKDVDQRQGGGGMKLDYIAIDKVYKRLNEVFPMGYSIEINDLRILDKDIVVCISLTINLDNNTIIRDGIGSHKIQNDTDMTVKTAFAEAVKKACHSLGIALYLWDESERLQLARDRAKIKRDDAKATAFTSDQIKSMKDIKSKLKITTNDGLDKYLNEWSDGKIKNSSRLTTNNLNEFVGFMKDKYEV